MTRERIPGGITWRRGRLCFTLIWRDLYIGAVIDPDQGMVYLAPLPCCVFGWRYADEAQSTP